MNPESQSHSSPIGIGVITILTILLVLTLAMFTALTFSSAQADFSLSKVNAETVCAYYTADAKAEKIAADFAAGNTPSLSVRIPISTYQSLSIHLERISENTYRRLEWKIVSTTESSSTVDEPLPVWDGQSNP